MSRGDPRPALALQAFIVLCRYFDDSRKWWMGKWFDKLRDGKVVRLLKGYEKLWHPIRAVTGESVRERERGEMIRCHVGSCMLLAAAPRAR